MDIKNIISLLAVFVFIVLLLLSKDAKRSYILFVVFAFPIIDLFVTPVSMGGFKVFDIVTYIALIFIVRSASSYSAPFGTYSFLIFILSILLFIGCLNSEFAKDSLVSLAQFFSVLIYAWLLIEECHENPEFYLVVIKALKLSCLISLAFLAVQLIYGLSFALYKLNPNASSYDALIRYPSYFQDPQKYGQFLSICSFLFLIENKKLNGGFFLNTILFGGVVCGLFLSGVRAAFFGLCIGLFLVFIFGERKYKLMGFFCIVAGFFVFLFFSDHFALFNRGANVADSADVRYAYWMGALKIFLKYPLLGIGIGNYQHYVSLHAQQQYWEYFGTIEYVDHPESGYLKFLAEFGLLGFMIVISLIVAPMVTAVKVLYKDFNSNKTLLFLIAAVVSWMVAFTTMYSFSDLRVFLLIVTLICIVISLTRKSFHKKITYAYLRKD